MRRLSLALLSGLALAVAAAPASAGRTAAPDTTLLADLVRALTAPQLAGRGAGGPGVLAAADLLAAEFAAAGLQPAWQDGRQEFPLEGEGWTGNDLSGLLGRNVAALLPGSGDLKDRWIIVGAHHDHLGLVDPGAGGGLPGPADYYPGANDNAGGVALVQLLAARLAGDDDAAHRRGVVFVHFDAEEAGLQGARAFVQDPPVPLDGVDAMVNLDTVGRLLDGKLFVSGVGTAAALPALVRQAGRPGLPLSVAEGGWSGSDHMIFNTREIPVLFLFGGPYPEYNRPADTWDTLDYDAMVRVADYAVDLLRALRTTTEDLAWRMVAEPELRDDDGGGGDLPQNRSTWLGTLPDFSDEIAGYKLAGVFDGSPAKRAGLEKGDVLVRLAGREISDLATFTRALRASDPGDVVEVEVLRSGRRLQFTVVLGDRAQRR